MSINEFTSEVRSLFQDKNPPFLFVGSGFSRRHLNLEDFENLLRHSCISSIRNFEYYYSTSSADLPKTALSIAMDFQEKIWEDPEYQTFIESYKKDFIQNTDAYKIHIAQLIAGQQCLAKDMDYLLYDEVEKLKRATIDAIITTNYDTFLEEIFPQFKVFIGQDELIQNNPQFIGEIYKIHGCITDPKNIVITSKDYEDFSQKNPYLTAKLISSFVERPILFIGYSVQDKHIQGILKIVTSCFQHNIDKIRGNFIFLKRSHGAQAKCTEAILTLTDLNIPYVLIETDDFGAVYEQIDSQRKIPANLMRMIKEQIYEIALTTDTKKKIKVIEPEILDETSEIEFLVGIGVKKLSEKGYKSINRKDLLNDIVYDKNEYNANKLLSETIPKLLKSNKFVPCYKYAQELENYNLVPEKIGKLKREKYTSNKSQAERDFKKIELQTVHGIIDYAITQREDLTWAMGIIPLLPHEIVKEEIDVLKDYLQNLLREDLITPQKETIFGKLVCFYDRSVYSTDWDE